MVSRIVKIKEGGEDLLNLSLIDAGNGYPFVTPLVAAQNSNCGFWDLK